MGANRMPTRPACAPRVASGARPRAPRREARGEVGEGRDMVIRRVERSGHDAATDAAANVRGPDADSLLPAPFWNGIDARRAVVLRAPCANRDRGGAAGAPA